MLLFVCLIVNDEGEILLFVCFIVCEQRRDAPFLSVSEQMRDAPFRMSY